MTAPALPPWPRFRCAADEPPKKRGGMYGKRHSLHAGMGLVLDEFTFEDLIHVEQMDDDGYYARVGSHVFYLIRKDGKWTTRLHEVETPARRHIAKVPK